MSTYDHACEADADAPALPHETIRFTKNGRVTIPKRIREALNIRQGQKGVLIELGGALLILPRPPRTPTLFDEIRGGLGTSDMSLEEMALEMRRVRAGNDYESKA